jgi:hypothetical protein
MDPDRHCSDAAPRPCLWQGYVCIRVPTFFSSGGSRALVFFFLLLPELTSCACISSAELLYSSCSCCCRPPLLPAASSAPLAITGSMRDASASGDALRGSGNSTSVLLSPTTAVSEAVVLPRPFFRFLRRCSGSGRGGSSGASSAGFSS